MQPERNYCFPLPHPPFHFSLPALQFLLPPLLRLSSPPSIFFCPYSPVSLSPLPPTPATTITLHQSPGPLCQPASPMPPRSSKYFFSICSTYLDPPTSLRSLLSTLYPSVALLFLLLTSRPFSPWLLLMPFPCWKAYRQPWPWCREHMKLCNYKQLVEKEKIQTKCL